METEFDDEESAKRFEEKMRKLFLGDDMEVIQGK
jgi:hypothetical protein